MSDTQLAKSLNAPDSVQDRGAFKQQVMQAAIEAGYLGDDRIIASFVDPDGVARTIQSLKQAFPDNFQHTFAAKANTMRKALQLIKSQGLGCEVASRGELEQAMRVGFEPQNIVYDEPAKTEFIIRRTLADGVSLNIDNFQEFELISSIMRSSGSDSRVGFRINPQVGAGTIGAMSTATKSSKFGIALDDEGNRSRIIDRYKSNRWLTSMHTHIGSQGCTLALMVTGIRKIVDLVVEINSAIGDQQIKVIDIGGGLPVNFDCDEFKPTFAEYAEVLRAKIP